jgi:hypothetical protein
MDDRLKDISEVTDIEGVWRWMLWSTGVVLVFVLNNIT